MKGNIHETENYSWGVIQDMIEKEISSAFKLREPSSVAAAILPTKKEIKTLIKKTVMDERKKKR
jgi:hypothetical protein|tara:strand:- start:1047 stop:1238 length:192 start_codon:yes stop_codon:yes gene_type:complete